MFVSTFHLFVTCFHFEKKERKFALFGLAFFGTRRVILDEGIVWIFLLVTLCKVCVFVFKKSMKDLNNLQTKPRKSTGLN